MKLERTPHNPSDLLEFYQEGLGRLGALCERTWHDRLEIIAEGRAARLWKADGALHEVELQFAAADARTARDAEREVFPGCPLTFRLAEALRVSPLPLERFFLPETGEARPPEMATLEKLWRAQIPDTARWQAVEPLRPDFHFALLALVRVEIQAMDQHWSLHRIALSLADGEADPALAREIGFHQGSAATSPAVGWPSPDLVQWRALLQRALEGELAEELEGVRVRQEKSLRRELERIDDYFQGYERELAARAKRTGPGGSRVKSDDRLAAAKAEHERRRADQVGRHEIRVLPQLDALLLVAENAWRARLRVERLHNARDLEALFIPRSRQWRVLKYSEQK
jgi:hypothetical protein